MTGYHNALLDFWTQFSVPCFLSGNVPDGQPFPYITLDIVRPAAFASTALTAISWHQMSDITPQPMTERAELMKRIAQAIPEGGTVLRFDGGYAMLRRNSATFQSYMTDPDDESVIGGRTSYEITYYGM